MIKLLGIPFHFGQRGRSVAQAPKALRAGGIVELLKGFDDVISLPDLTFDESENDPLRISHASQRIQQRVLCELDGSSCLINIGGDHGISLGTISAVLERDPETIVIWVDAHGDTNTPESSVTKNFHGMPVSYLLGLNQHDEAFSWCQSFLRPQKLIYFGVRDLDPFEGQLIESLGIQCYTAGEMNEKGVERLLGEALEKADPENRCRLHLSFDLDVFDRADFKATGLPLPGGPQKSELFTLASLLGRSTRLRSLDIVEYHPHETGNHQDSDDQQVIWDLLTNIFKGPTVIS